DESQEPDERTGKCGGKPDGVFVPHLFLGLPLPEDVCRDCKCNKQDGRFNDCIKTPRIIEDLIEDASRVCDDSGPHVGGMLRDEEREGCMVCRDIPCSGGVLRVLGMD